jgi:hypothetical protein
MRMNVIHIIPSDSFPMKLPIIWNPRLSWLNTPEVILETE